MTASTSTPVPAVGGVQTVRRVVTYLLLLTLVIIAAIGVTGLLERALDAGNRFVVGGSDGLAQSLAFALIAGPLAALLWWLTWRESAMSRDRSSVAWPVYLVVASTLTLLVFTISLLSWGASVVEGYWQWSGLAVPIVWGLVWLWHYWMWHHATKGPTRLSGVTPAIASLIGLSFLTGGLVFALATLIDVAIDSYSSTVISGELWRPVVQSLIWAVGGALVWWWHWFRASVKSQSTGFANVLLVYITGFASFAVFVFGATVTLSIVLDLVAGASAPLAVTLEPLGLAVSAAAFGALVMRYHLRVVSTHPAAIGSAVRLVTSGVSLAVAASGVGVTINALLATLASPIVGHDVRSLLLSGISALIVGGLLWWVSWRPSSAATVQRASTPGRRVFLVVIFGVSALVALITLLVIGYQLFSYALDGGYSGSLVEHIRAALGLLVATGLVAAYHFALWRSDRKIAVVSETPQVIARVTLVTSAAAGGPVEGLAEAVRAATGARVTVHRRAVTVDGEPDADSLIAALLASLDGASAGHVLIVAGAKAKTEVIRLEG